MKYEATDTATKGSELFSRKGKSVFSRNMSEVQFIQKSDTQLYNLEHVLY